jgi:hypothetical protein
MLSPSSSSRLRGAEQCEPPQLGQVFDFLYASHGSQWHSGKFPSKSPCFQLMFVSEVGMGALNRSSREEAVGGMFSSVRCGFLDWMMLV